MGFIDPNRPLPAATSIDPDGARPGGTGPDPTGCKPGGSGPGPWGITASACCLLAALLLGCSINGKPSRIWLCGTIDGKPLRVAIDDRFYVETEAATVLDLHPCSAAERKAKLHA